MPHCLTGTRTCLQAEQSLVRQCRIVWPETWLASKQHSAVYANATLPNRNPDLLASSTKPCTPMPLCLTGTLTCWQAAQSLVRQCRIAWPEPWLAGKQSRAFYANAALPDRNPDLLASRAEPSTPMPHCLNGTLTWILGQQTETT